MIHINKRDLYEAVEDYGGGVVRLCGGNLHAGAVCGADGDAAPRVALVYTVTTPELKADVERALRESVGRNVELMVYEVPDAFNEIRAEDYLTPHAAALIAGTYMRAVEDGADAVLSICSTVEDVAYAMQDAARLVGVPVVMVNDAMCREAAAPRPYDSRRGYFPLFDSSYTPYAGACGT